MQKWLITLVEGHTPTADLITATGQIMQIMAIIVAFPAARVQADAAMRNGGGAGVTAGAAATAEAGVGRVTPMTVGEEESIVNTGTDTKGNIAVEAAVVIEIGRRNITNIDIQGKVTNIAVSIQTKKIGTIIENTKNETGKLIHSLG